MIQLCSSARVLMLMSCAALLVAGCPESAQLGNIDVPPIDEKEVFRVLGEAVGTTELTEAEFSPDAQLPGDEVVNFGEAEALFDAVPFDAIDLSKDVILPETETDVGGLLQAHGGLAGHFVNDVPDSNSDHSSGVFRGRWFSADGEARGVVRGEYRPLPPDALPPGIVGGGVFHGKHVGLDGRFRGFVRGRYGHPQDGRGFFFGRWFDRHNRLIGVLEGHWEDDPELNGGTFRGRWAAFNICDEADSLIDPNADDDEWLSADELEELSAVDPQLDRLATSIAFEDVESAEGDRVGIMDEPDLTMPGEPPCIDPNAPYGFLRGWHRPGPPEDPNDPGPPHGVFHGRWRTADRRPVGQLVGRYLAADEPPPPGNPPPPGVHGTYQGRYLDRAGKIRGYLRGVYGLSPHGLGVFRGRYFAHDGQPLGVLFGRWDVAPNRPGGPFFGFWAGVEFGEDPELAP